MQVMIATKLTQGKRKNDFCHANLGELVRFGMCCDGATADDNCGCARSFVGFESHKATTTARIIELPITKEQFVTELRTAYDSGGWASLFKDEPAKLNEMIEDEAAELLRIAAAFPRGRIIENRNIKIKTRVA